MMMLYLVFSIRYLHRQILPSTSFGIPILSSLIMLVCCFLAYISATYMVEAVAMANSQDDNRRRDSLFKEEAYKTPQMQRKSNDPDLKNKDSPYYVR